MKKFIVIVGPHAVGKMTVGQELMKLTNIPLFHNHMSIEFASYLHGSNYNKDMKTLSAKLREVIFDSVAKGDNNGLIFTFMLAFDDQSDVEYLNGSMKLFEDNGADSYLVELCASKDVRLDRNVTENRLKNKPTKRDIESSTQRFIEIEDKYRLNSYDGEITRNNYIKIDNTNLDPSEVAKIIKDKFSL